MGDLGTTWFYKVPYVGQDILGGYRNGQPYMRPAMVEDCRVYPNLRLIITSMGLDRPMYDGPAFDWDPKIPIIQFTVDDWAWEPLGRSLVGDVASIETTKRKIERKVDNVVTVTLNPPMGYDMTQTGGPKVEHFDIFEQDVRIGVDGKPKDTLQSVLPDEVRVDAVHFQFLKYLKDAEQEQLGLSDLGNLQNMKMNIANETADKMLESIGPIAKGIAARIEKANKAVGNRMKYLIPQWFNVRALDGVRRSGSHVARGSRLQPRLTGAEPFARRVCRWKFRDRVEVRPDDARSLLCQARAVDIGSEHASEDHAMQEQLKYPQLKRGQAPISWLTVFTKMDIQNPEEEIDKSFKEEVKSRS